MKKLLKDICDFFNGLLGNVFGEKVNAEDIELNEEEMEEVDKAINDFASWFSVSEEELAARKEDYIAEAKAKKAEAINDNRPFAKVRDFVVGVLTIAAFIFLFKFAAFRALVAIFVVIPAVLLLAGLFVALFAIASIF